MNITKQLILVLYFLSALPLYGAGVTVTPNKFVTEYDSYLGSSHIFPIALSITLFSGLFFTHAVSQKSRWYRELENRVREEAERERLARAKAQLEEENRRRAEENQAERDKRAQEEEKAQAERSRKEAELGAAQRKRVEDRQAQVKAKLQEDHSNFAAAAEGNDPLVVDAIDGDCPICLDPHPLYFSCNNLHLHCNDCLRKCSQQPSSVCSQCQTPYVFLKNLRGSWAPPANPLNDVD